MDRIKLLMLVICFVECYPMTLDEIEDFANFLERTSQLDQNLKKGSDPDEYDDDESISNHAWEDSGKFEGDIILNERQRRLIVEDVAVGLARNGLKDSTKRWPNNEVIYYIQKEHFNSDQMQAIQNGIDDLARASCVKFRPYQRGDRDAVVIQGSRRGCFSQVGYQSGYQVLNLSGRHPVGRGCFRHGTVVHELLHSLGFYHMQSSPDRDDYVDVLWQNIIQPARHNFRKYNTFAVSDFGVGYDYESVLHYSRRAFSANGQDTIVPKKSGAEIGQRLGLSDKDTQKLNRMYCDADSSNSEADEEPKKPNLRTKSEKNKPFEGHGIGYHQGKAVVIKLLPAAETYKLPDVPSFHLFDYFSKAPQVMSTTETEGFRIGKEIIHPYHPSPPFNVEEYRKHMKQITNENVEKETSKRYNNHNESKDKTIEAESPVKGQMEDKKETLDVEKDPQTNHNLNHTTEDIDENLSEAFERLANIVKNHVYPSSYSADSRTYLIDKDYSTFYNPSKLTKKGNYEHATKFNTSKASINESETLTKDPYYRFRPYSRNAGTHDKIRIDENNKDSKIIHDVINKEVGSSYGNWLPSHSDNYNREYLQQSEIPEYVSREKLANRNNFNYLYPSQTESDKNIKDGYILFGDDVPLNKDMWYQNTEFKKSDYNGKLDTKGPYKKPNSNIDDIFHKPSVIEFEKVDEDEHVSRFSIPDKRQAFTFQKSVPFISHIKTLPVSASLKTNRNAESKR